MNRGIRLLFLIVVKFEQRLVTLGTGFQQAESSNEVNYPMLAIGVVLEYGN